MSHEIHAETVEEAAAKIARRINSKTWCQGTYARTKTKRPAATVQSRSAVAFCASGWTYKVASHDVRRRLHAAVMEVLGGRSLAFANDAPDTTWRDVRGWFLRVAGR